MILCELQDVIGKKFDVNNIQNWSKTNIGDALIRMYATTPHIKQAELPRELRASITSHFGKLTDAKKLLGITSSARKSRFQRDDIIREVLNILKDGGNYEDIKEFKSLHNALCRDFGGVRSFEETTGISVPKVPRKSQKLRKYTEEQLLEFLKSVSQRGLSGAKAAQEDRSKRDACCKYWGSWNKALESNGLPIFLRMDKKVFSRSELIYTYVLEESKGVPRARRSNQSSIEREFGGVAMLRKILRLDEPPTPRVLSTSEIDRYVDEALALNEPTINQKVLDSVHPSLTKSIKHHYRTTVDYFTQRDVDRYKKPYMPFNWTKENVVWQLKRWIREGKPVNYTAVQFSHKGILEASRRLFGSYAQAFEYAGLNYEDYRVDTDMACRQGGIFENIVSEILTDLQVAYVREPEINGCHPDFVVGRTWIDAKLSEWTVSHADCGTIKKYLPNCEKLYIVYLRGYRTEKQWTTDGGVTFVHVDELLKPLPEQKALLYREKLNGILETLAEKAA